MRPQGKFPPPGPPFSPNGKTETSDSPNSQSPQVQFPVASIQQIVESLKSLAERHAPLRANRVHVPKLDVAAAPDLDEWFLVFEAECDARALPAGDRLEALRLNLGLQ